MRKVHVFSLDQSSFITQNCAFKEEKEILDFLTLANKDLFEKIEAARIIEKLNREVNQ